VLIGFPFQTILPGLLENELDRPARTVGFMLGVSAVGGFASGITLAGFAGSRFALPVQLLLGVIFGVSLIWLALSPSFGMALAAVFMVGLGSGGFQMLNQSQLMTTTAPAYHGRVMSLQMLAWGGSGLMSLPLGIFADSLGERAVLSGMGVGVCAVLGLGILFYRVLVPSRERPELVEIAAKPLQPPASGPAYVAASNGANGANGATRAPRVAPRPLVTSRAPTPALASNGARPRRRVGRDFMTGRGVIVGRDYM
jgi:predicted MFS family arabinose efflux permease